MRFWLPHPAIAVLFLVTAYVLGRALGELMFGPTPMAPQPPPMDDYGHHQLWEEAP